MNSWGWEINEGIRIAGSEEDLPINGEHLAIIGELPGSTG
jgi:hypothetical protein